MGQLTISSSVSRRSVAPIPSSSLLPRRFLRATCGSDFGTRNALLGLGFGWLAAELFDWLLGRDRSVGVGAELLVADGGRARVLRRDADDADGVAVAEDGRAADLVVAFVFIVLVVNFGVVRLQIYTYIEPGKRRSDKGDWPFSVYVCGGIPFPCRDACLEPKGSPECLLDSLEASFGGKSWPCLWLKTSASALLTPVPVLPTPSEWRIDAGRGIPGLCAFESFPAAAALSVEGFEASASVEDGIVRWANKQRTKQHQPLNDLQRTRRFFECCRYV